MKLHRPAVALKPCLPLHLRGALSESSPSPWRSRLSAQATPKTTIREADPDEHPAGSCQPLWTTPPRVLAQADAKSRAVDRDREPAGARPALIGAPGGGPSLTATPSRVQRPILTWCRCVLQGDYDALRTSVRCQGLGTIEWGWSSAGFAVQDRRGLPRCAKAALPGGEVQLRRRRQPAAHWPALLAQQPDKLPDAHVHPYKGATPRRWGGRLVGRRSDLGFQGCGTVSNQLIMKASCACSL